MSTNFSNSETGKIVSPQKIFIAAIIITAMAGTFTRIEPSQAREVQAVKSGDFPLVIAAEMPKEARETLSLIRKGGPFPYSKDGVVFGNREQALPKQARGYYHEYTVKTPGARNRGTRRIVCGGNPKPAASECYYSDNHYESFRKIKE